MDLNIPRNLKEITMFQKFLIVGGFGFLIDNGALFLLVDFLQADVVISKIASAELSILLMFAANERWTFKEHDTGHILHRLFKSNMVRIGGFLVALIILKLLYEGFGLHVVVANSIGILAGFGFNYVLESLHTWKIHKDVK